MPDEVNDDEARQAGEGAAEIRGYPAGWRYGAGSV